MCEGRLYGFSYQSGCQVSIWIPHRLMELREYSGCYLLEELRSVCGLWAYNWALTFMDPPGSVGSYSKEDKRKWCEDVVHEVECPASLGWPPLTHFISPFECTVSYKIHCLSFFINKKLVLSSLFLATRRLSQPSWSRGRRKQFQESILGINASAANLRKYSFD